MEKIKRIALNSCAFAVLISVLFFAFAKISGLSEVKIDFLHFFIILLFGIVIAVANTVFELPKIHIALKFLIHYVVLLISFYIVFINFGNVSASGPAVIFTTVIVFSIFYVFFAVIIWLIKKIFGIKISANNSKTSSKDSKETYKPRYNN